MISRAGISLIRSLRLGKFRKKNGLFVCEGPKLTEEIISSSFHIEKVYCLESWKEDHVPLLDSRIIDFEVVTDKELRQISSLSTPNEVLAVVRIPDRTIPENGLTPGISLILDDMRDPGNLGTIIRLADWFGLKSIVCSRQTVDVYNPKVVQATMGSIARVPVYYEDLQEILAHYSGKIKIYGTGMKGRNVYSEDLPANALIITGNESRGISPQLEPFIDTMLSIPSPGMGAESLNASIATAVIVSEFRRKDLTANKT